MRSSECQPGSIGAPECGCSSLNQMRYTAASSCKVGVQHWCMPAVVGGRGVVTPGENKDVEWERDEADEDEKMVLMMHCRVVVGGASDERP